MADARLSATALSTWSPAIAAVCQRLWAAAEERL